MKKTCTSFVRLPRTGGDRPAFIPQTWHDSRDPGSPARAGIDPRDSHVIGNRVVYGSPARAGIDRLGLTHPGAVRIAGSPARAGIDRSPSTAS